MWNTSHICRKEVKTALQRCENEFHDLCNALEEERSNNDDDTTVVVVHVRVSDTRVGSYHVRYPIGYGNQLGLSLQQNNTNNTNVTSLALDLSTATTTTDTNSNNNNNHIDLLLEFTRTSPTLRTLDLCDGLYATRMEEQHLNNNDSTYYTPHISAILEAIAVNPSIRELIFNKVTEMSIPIDVFANCLQRTTSLQRLEMKLDSLLPPMGGGGGGGDTSNATAANVVGVAFGINTTLEYIRFYDITDNSTLVFGSILHHLRQHPTLTTLSLQRCSSTRFDSYRKSLQRHRYIRQVEHLSNYIQQNTNTNLQHLELEFWSFVDNVRMSLLSHAIQSNTSLLHLTLRHCRIHRGTAQPIFVQLVQQHHMGGSGCAGDGHRRRHHHHHYRRPSKTTTTGAETTIRAIHNDDDVSSTVASLTTASSSSSLSMLQTLTLDSTLTGNGCGGKYSATMASQMLIGSNVSTLQLLEGFMCSHMEFTASVCRFLQSHASQIFITSLQLGGIMYDEWNAVAECLPHLIHQRELILPHFEPDHYIIREMNDIEDEETSMLRNSEYFVDAMRYNGSLYKVQIVESINFARDEGRGFLKDELQFVEAYCQRNYFMNETLQVSQARIVVGMDNNDHPNNNDVVVNDDSTTTTTKRKLPLNVALIPTIMYCAQEVCVFGPRSILTMLVYAAADSVGPSHCRQQQQQCRVQQI